MTDMTIDEELSITCEQRDALDIECARLEKEVDALRKDAERYRWLRKHLVNWCPDDDTARLSWSAREVLDAEIDAAMNGANDNYIPTSPHKSAIPTGEPGVIRRDVGLTDNTRDGGEE